MKYKKGDKLVCIKFFDWGDDRIYYPNNFYESTISLFQVICLFYRVRQRKQLHL